MRVSLAVLASALLACALGLAAATTDYALCSAGVSSASLSSLGDEFGCNGYQNLATRTWSVDLAGPIQLNFLSFNTEFSWDYVRLYKDGVGVAGFSGAASVPYVFFSNAPGQWKVVFSSDESTTAAGFKISLSLGVIDASCQVIGGTQAFDGGIQYCYRVFAAGIHSISANEAEALCNAWSPAAHLASVHSSTMNAALSNAIDALSGDLHQFWIGPTDAAAEGTFVNRDSTPFDYNNWAPKEPNDHPVVGSLSNEDCTVSNWQGTDFRDQKWNDLPCEARLTPYFACSVLTDALIPGGNVAPCTCQGTSVSDPGTSVSISFSSSGATLAC